MKKIYKFLMIFIIVTSFTLTFFVIINEIKTYDDLSVDYLKENSEFCMLVITMEETEFPENDILIGRNPFF